MLSNKIIQRTSVDIDSVVHSARQIMLAASLLLVAAGSSRAQTLQQLMPSAVAAPIGTGQDLIANPFSPSDSLLMVTTSAAGSIWRIRSTSLTGEPPYARFEAVPLNAALSSASRIAYNGPDGSIYVAGNSTTPISRNSSVITWTVMSSSDGNSWQVSDQFRFVSRNTLYSSWAQGVVTDAAGNVYVSGYANEGKVDHWIVRRKQAGAAAWETVYDAKAGAFSALPYGMCFVGPSPNHASAAVYSVGIFNNRWTVLQSRAAGAINTWQTVDTWPGDGTTANAYDIASDNQGNLFVVGVRGKDGSNKGWVVRKSTDGGTTWVTVLDKAEGVYSWAWRILIDSADNVWVSGAVHRPDNFPRWTLVRNSPGQQWQDSADGSDSWSHRTLLPTNPGYKSKGRGMTLDPAGNLFLTGDAIDSSIPINTYVGLLRLTQ